MRKLFFLSVIQLADGPLRSLKNGRYRTRHTPNGAVVSDVNLAVESRSPVLAGRGALSKPRPLPEKATENSLDLQEIY